MVTEVIVPSKGCSPHAFGAALAAFGDELLVGAPCGDYLARVHEGIPPPVACLLRRTAGQWAQAEQLGASNPRMAEGFARSVLVGSSFAIVGAPGSENGDGPAFDFDRTGSSRFRLRAEAQWVGEPDSFAEYGASLAADETVLLVGAPLDAAVCDGGGAVHVFDRRTMSCAPIATLRGTHPDEGFGSALAMHGDLLVVGAAARFSNEQLSGAAYVYHREAPDRWHEIARISGQRPGEEFGACVAIEGELIAVSAPGRGDLGAPAGGGQVRVYQPRGSAWGEVASVREPSGFGSSLALRGDRLAVGQPMHSHPSGVEQAGRVGLFRVTASGITHDAWLEHAAAPPYSRIGSAVALGDDYVAAGAPGLGDVPGVGFVLVRRW